MKTHHIFFIITSLTSIFLSPQSAILSTTQRQKTYVIQNTKSPFCGRTAFRKNALEPWYIPGLPNKEPTWEKYKKGQSLAPGITYDVASDYPNGFKKIYWNQMLLDEDSYCRDDYTFVVECLNNGFSVKAWEEEALGWKGFSMPKKSGCPLLYHPKAQKAVTHLMKTTKEDYNVFEIGCLLGYRIQDAYVWSFGSDQGKKAYPNKTFFNRKANYHSPKKLLWRKLGLNRLKDELGDEYGYIIAGDEPTNDSVFGSIQEEEYLKELRNKKILVYGGMVVGGVLWAGILYCFFYGSKNKKSNKSILQKSLKILNLGNHCIDSLY